MPQAGRVTMCDFGAAYCFPFIYLSISCSIIVKNSVLHILLLRQIRGRKRRARCSWPAETWHQRPGRGADVLAWWVTTAPAANSPEELQVIYSITPTVTRRPSLQMKVRRHLSTVQAGEGSHRCSEMSYSSNSSNFMSAVLTLFEYGWRRQTN